MRIALLCSVLLLTGGVQNPGGDEQETGKPPERGDAVIARGCLKGSRLESSDLTKQKGKGRFDGFVTYRLTGDRKILNELKKEHDGHVDVISAELRTDLPSGMGEGGARIGNSRITIGVGPSRGMGPEPPPPVPVLRVTSFEHTGITCR